MKKTKITLLLILIFSFSCSILFAGEPDLVIRSLRQRAMGGAGLAVANDLDALVINPACLTEIEGFKVKLVSVYAQGSNDLVEKQSELTDLDPDDQDAFTTTMQTLVPSKIGVGVMPEFGIAWKGFGIGVFGQSNTDLAVYNRTNPNIVMFGNADVAGILGLTFPIELFNTKFSSGLNIKYVNRYSLLNDSQEIGSTVFSLPDIMKMSGDDSVSPTLNYYNVSGMSFDIGLLSVMETPIGDGTFGLVIRDIGSSLSGNKIQTTASANPTETPFSTTIPMSAAIGMGLKSSMPDVPFIGFMLTDLTLAIDYDLISQGSSLYKKLHIGVEKELLAGILKLRGGMNQGYFVGGFGLDILFLHVHYAYHKEALGSEVGIDERDYHLVQVGVLSL
ncbi:hypothetical protein ACFL2K_05430 [Candidatus Margulisiibacteriota bacterium]